MILNKNNNTSVRNAILYLLIIFMSAHLLSCASRQAGGSSLVNNKASYKSEMRPSREQINVNTFITTAGNPTVSVYKYKLDPEVHDEWARVVFWGFEAASRVAEDDCVLAVGVIFTDGKSEGYFISNRDYTDYKNKKITNDEFVNRIRKKKLSDK